MSALTDLADLAKRAAAAGAVDSGGLRVSRRDLLDPLLAAGAQLEVDQESDDAARAELRAAAAHVWSLEALTVRVDVETQAAIPVLRGYASRLARRAEEVAGGDLRLAPLLALLADAADASLSTGPRADHLGSVGSGLREVVAGLRSAVEECTRGPGDQAELARRLRAGATHLHRAASALPAATVRLDYCLTVEPPRLGETEPDVLIIAPGGGPGARLHPQLAAQTRDDMVWLDTYRARQLAEKWRGRLEPGETLVARERRTVETQSRLEVDEL